MEKIKVSTQLTSEQFRKYSDATTILKLHQDTEPIKRRVRQGDTMSPKLLHAWKKYFKS